MSGGAGSPRGRLLRWAGSLILLGFAGKFLGLLVSILTARYLGMDPSLDAYVVAQALPEMLLQVAMIGALAQILVPILTEREHAQGAAAAAEFSRRVLGLLLLVSAGLTLAAALAAGPLVRAMAPGFDIDRHALAVRLFLILLLNVPIGALIYFGRALLQIRRRFELAAGAAVVASVAQVVSVLLLVPGHGVAGLAMATILLNLTTLIVLGVGVAPRPAWVYPPRWPRPDPDMRRLLRLSLIFGSYALVSVLSFATDRWFASLLPPGSVATLAYAWRFEPIFLVVIAGAAATPVYTDLSEAAAVGDEQVFQAALVRGLKLVALVVLPAAALLAGLAHPLVETLLQRGAFQAGNTQQVARVLAVLTGAFACWSIGALMIQALNARQEPRLSLVVGLVSTGLNFLLDAALYRHFGVLGLALATTIISLPMTLLLTTLVLRRVAGGWPPGLVAFLSAVMLISLVAGAAAWGTQRGLHTLAAPVRLVVGAAAGLVPLAVGVALLRPTELRSLARRLAR